ncbi:MAG: GTPase HflX [Ruminococcus flavefaciens]|nr:GTPase HflX [Ruminococcus flavefaciens]MCM1360844.1 GTPase HflX [Clostridiales bacterium]MCM1434932.1 GTPase HflX [Ruminococcus flavefaciens]
MYENKIEELPVKTVLACVDIGEFDAETSINELAELAETANAEVVGTVIQKKTSYDPATCMGAGRLQELKEQLEPLEAELVIFDHELTGIQVRNIEEILGVRVIDRTTLILDIFAQRARTKEGKLQVELAQQKYRLPRLTGMGTALSRLGGGIGTRGPGETKLETDKRHIRRRISYLESELEELKKHRNFSRSRRKKDGVLCAAIVGYTNVGKSTLLNALTDAGVLAENKLFATLDITSRSVELPDGRTVMLIDTVGLIRRLPHNLVEAFKSTLEEAAAADVILNVQDLSSPERIQQAEVTEKLLTELGCSDIPKINVMNKLDAAIDADTVFEDDSTVLISAKERIGFDKLLDCIAAKLPETAKRMKLLVPYDRTAFIGKIREDGRIFSEEYTENGTLIDALVDIKLVKEAQEMII